MVLIALLSTSFCPVRTRTQTDIQKCLPVRNSARITISAYGVTFSTCKVIKGHINNPYAYPGCVAISSAVGSATGAAYTYWAYDSDAWAWFGEHIHWEWLSGFGGIGGKGEDL